VLPKVIIHDAALTLPGPIRVALGLNALAHCVVMEHRDRERDRKLPTASWSPPVKPSS
jgi:hypothetical protein